jgi:hypothetical protein
MATPENTKLCDFISTNNNDFICTPIAAALLRASVDSRYESMWCRAPSADEVGALDLLFFSYDYFEPNMCALSLNILLENLTKLLKFTSFLILRANIVIFNERWCAQGELFVGVLSC